MKYNIAEVVSGRKREISFTDSFTIDAALARINHSAAASSIEVSGKVYRVDDALWINLTYVGMVQFVCDRCLQPFDYPLRGQFKRQLSSRDEFDVEWLLIERDQIDLAAAVADDFQCKSEAVDPRLASLKNLFN